MQTAEDGPTVVVTHSLHMKEFFASTGYSCRTTYYGGWGGGTMHRVRRFAPVPSMTLGFIFALVMGAVCSFASPVIGVPPFSIFLVAAGMIGLCVYLAQMPPTFEVWEAEGSESTWSIQAKRRTSDEAYALATKMRKEFSFPIAVTICS